MATAKPAAVPFPLSSFPGANPQEAGGRLINCYAEPLSEGGSTAISKQVWRRQAGLSLFSRSAHSGYRGGLIVNNLLYEAWFNVAATCDSAGNVTDLGAFPGSKFVSIARNQVQPSPDVVAVDPDNGAYVLSGGGPPVAYTGAGAMPIPNSVCFQDGYFIFTVGNGQVFATGLNSLTMNALTFITVQSKSDVVLLRGIAFSGLLFLFTTASCEIWQDTAQPPPGFPYTRYAVIEFGLLQSGAIAGAETGFSELLWVGQNCGVYHLAPNTVQPDKVSPPDLDRAIEKQSNAGNLLEAGCYYYAGHKFWHLSSPDWTWEYNLGTGRWAERMSLLPSGIHGRWRGKGGHPAFNKFIFGDAQSGNLLFTDDQNFTDVGMPQLFRLESGPVAEFPAQLRIARADFLFDMGVGIAAGNFTMTVSNAVKAADGSINLSVNDTSQAHSHDTVIVSNVHGTDEANGTWQITVIDAQTINLIGSVFANAYTLGGTAVDVTSPPTSVDPKCAVSTSLDGGLTWGNPLIRSLGQQGRAKRSRVSVKNMGVASPMGNRWRLDVTDAVYTGFLMGTQSSDPREPGA